MTKGNKKNIAVFISGAGSNAVNIIQHFTENSSARITHIFSNRPEKGALKISENENVSLVAFNKADFLPNGEIYKTLLKTKIDYIVLAGFLLKIPEALIQMFPDRIVPCRYHCE